jgi:hypothetical protein
VSHGAAKAAMVTGNVERAKVHVAKLAEVCSQPLGCCPSQLDVKDTQLAGLPCAWFGRP